MVGLLMFSLYFYPRSPCGERRYQQTAYLLLSDDFYPRSPCGERLELYMISRFGKLISIHALLAESDTNLPASIFALLRFLSTLSLRRATHDCFCRFSCHIHFYPRSPCGERLVHALKLTDAMLFLSTLSLRRATAQKNSKRPFLPISIHALLAESDLPSLQRLLISYLFLSTLSLRRATIQTLILLMERLFLSTLSLRRATSQQPPGTTSTTYFYPRSPCGERPVTRVASTPTTVISIHALLAESDTDVSYLSIDNTISIHALLAESDS